MKEWDEEWGKESKIKCDKRKILRSKRTFPLIRKNEKEAKKKKRKKSKTWKINRERIIFFTKKLKKKYNNVNPNAKKKKTIF